MPRFFENVSEKDWNDWQWQLRNRLSSLENLKKIFPLDKDKEKEIRSVLKDFRMAVTPYYLSLIDPDNPADPVKMQAIPSIYETHKDISDLDDPLHEDVDSPAPGLTHRYPDRVLLLTTHICSMYCRHCTRRRKVGDGVDTHFPKAQLEKCLDYIRKTPEVRDVIVSGGDPFTMTDQDIEWILQKLREIPHVEIIRIGTRTPVVMPMRITESLCSMIKKYHPVYINTHFNHAQEITPAAKKACALLADHGIQLGNQSVLLKGVNDDPAVMKELLLKLLSIRVRPYYIYQCDQATGISHFRTSVSAGINIIENVRGHISGLGVPQLVIDCPGGGGKVPIAPNYILSQAPGKMVLRNYEGKVITYTDDPEKVIKKEKESVKKYYSREGVAGLLNSAAFSLDYSGFIKKGPKRGKH